MKTLTEKKLNAMIKKGSEINQYTGFSIKVDGVWYECAHRFSF
jgi:hypothetical protein